jgi:hypothetical protein
VARETLETLRDLRRRVRNTTPALLLSEAIERLDAPRPDAKELADTALRTWSLPEIAAYRGCLIPELPVYGPVTGSAETFVSGRADAVAYNEGALAVVFDWKSDVAPSAADRALYAGQLAQYLRVLGGERGAIVYMTSGLVQWVAAAGRSGEAPRTPHDALAGLSATPLCSHGNCWSL